MLDLKIAPVEIGSINFFFLRGGGRQAGLHCFQPQTNKSHRISMLST